MKRFLQWLKDEIVQILRDEETLATRVHDRREQDDLAYRRWVNAKNGENAKRFREGRHS